MNQKPSAPTSPTVPDVMRVDTPAHAISDAADQLLLDGTGYATPLDIAALAQPVLPEIEQILRSAQATNGDSSPGLEALRKALSLAAERGPVEARPLAKEILDLLPDTGDVLITVDDTARYNLNAAVTLSPLTHMWLFTAEGRTGLHYETLFHETLHAYVALKYRTLRDTLGRFRNEGESGLDATATLAFAQFARVWDEFRTTSANERANDPQLAIAITDARNNPDEFFVRSLTDSKFQRYLAEKRYDGRTLWSRFKNWVKTNVFGIPKSDVTPSWLDAALLASKEVANTLRTRNDQNTATKTEHGDGAPAVDRGSQNLSAGKLSAWMGASSVVDSEGAPLLVFHGTRRTFDNFEMLSPRGALGNPAGAYFTADRHVAQRYAENDDGEIDEKSRVIAAYIRIESDDDGKIIDSAYRGREYVVFKPENILVQSNNLLRLPANARAAEASRAHIHEETTQFRSWFGNSKVVDRGGKPLMMYHGSNAAFDAFDPDKAGKNFRMGEVGMYFTSSPDQASLYAKHRKDGSPTVYPVYLSLQNPLVIEEDAGWGGVLSLIENNKSVKAKVRKAIASGLYDGVIARDMNPGADGEPDTVVIALRPEQIKSALGNSGAFDPQSPDMNASRTRTQESTHEFRAWFGTSKVVDEQGQALVLYHGTTANFSQFDPKESCDGGFHFGTSEAATARLTYLTEGADETIQPNVMPAYLSIKNPKEIDYDPFDEDSWAGVIAEAKDAGHDGIVYPNSVEGGESWVAFRADQIKSAVGNRGTFSPNDPDILHARARAQENSVEFIDWFGDSKIVNDAGAPLLVYHGTHHDITAFRHGIDSGNGVLPGFFFADESTLDYATGYVDQAHRDGANFLPVYLSIKNPMHVAARDEDTCGVHEWLNPEFERAQIAKAKASGHDGLVLESEYGEKFYVAFDPRQIKSATGNCGRFDPHDSDISASRSRVQEESENFKAWFGNSKAVDAGGRPLVLYHGSNADFTVFDLNYSWGGAAGTAFYFGDAETAGRYGGEDGETGRRVMPVYLSLQNPASDAELDEFEDRADRGEFAQDEISSELFKAGYDGVISEYRKIYVAFHPNQIKSAISNDGGFDPDNPDIMASRREPENTFQILVGAHLNEPQSVPDFDMSTGCIIEDEAGTCDVRKHSTRRRAP